MRVLYVTYFGLLNHLSQTQIIPYLRSLADDGLDITLLSYEPAHLCSPEGIGEVSRKLGPIRWKRLRYHKRPTAAATFFDVMFGCAYATFLTKRYGIDVVHVRSQVPAVIGLALRRLFGVKLVFDVRGLMAEEYVDAGSWKAGGVLFRMTKWVEARALDASDAVIVLTRWARDHVRRQNPRLAERNVPVEVIPCCYDPARFSPVDRQQERRRLGFEGKLVVAYCGALGSWYMTNEMAAFFAVLSRREPHAHFLVLTQYDYSLITVPLAQLGIPEAAFTITTAPVEQVREFLASADFAVSFIKPCISKRASSPTKIAEYLASGLPIISNSGIGDIDELLTVERVGVILKEFSDSAYGKAIDQMFELLSSGDAGREYCRAVAERKLSLVTVGVEGYHRVYHNMG